MEDERAKRERSSEGESELKVTDRRLFTDDGQLRDELDLSEEADPEFDAEVAEPPAPEPTVEAEPLSQESAGAEAGFEHESVEEPEGVDFSMLINGMAQPALLFLGEIPHPGTGEAQVDLEQARLQIDMLQLLRVKCRGNLTQMESGLLDRILYQLRMLYVSRSEAGQP